MKELIYTVLDLEEWSSNNARCEFCSKSENNDNKVVCQIRTRSKLTEKIIANDEACQKCKEKFLNDELSKCERCGRLQIKSYISILCRCIRENENLEEKKLPILPHERRPNVFYEKQINGLREELNTAEVEIDTHLEALEISEDWHKRQKQELLDKIKELETEVERLKKQTPQELVNEIESHKKEISELKEQMEQLSKQQQTQIEVPPKDKGIKGFFKFGGKK